MDLKSGLHKQDISTFTAIGLTKKSGGAYSNEGIILFSKVKCEKVTCGTGHREMDLQARVLTAEFEDCIMIFTYNPQGGFTEESLDFRKRWEQEFARYLEVMTKEAKGKNKKIIWAGDFNVNAYETGRRRRLK